MALLMQNLKAIGQELSSGDPLIFENVTELP